MVKLNKRGGIATIVLNRPKKRNALDAGTIDGLVRAIEKTDADKSIRCLIIRGAGGNFCAGRDLTVSSKRDLENTLASDEIWTKVNRLLHRMSKPTVAVVEGFAVAGGFTLAMICDFVIAQKGAKFGALEMRRGFPAAINTPVLSQLIGPRLALEFLLLGDLVTASRLYEVGLINHLADDGEALDLLVQKFTGALVRLDPDAVRMTKESHRAAKNMPLMDALEMGKLGNALIAASGRMDEAVRDYAQINEVD